MCKSVFTIYPSSVNKTIDFKDGRKVFLGLDDTGVPARVVVLNQDGERLDFGAPKCIKENGQTKWVQGTNTDSKQLFVFPPSEDKPSWYINAITRTDTPVGHYKADAITF